MPWLKLSHNACYGCANDFKTILKNEKKADYIVLKIKTWSESNQMSFNIGKSKIPCVKSETDINEDVTL